MTLTIDLREEEVKIKALTAKARGQGVSAEEYARLVLEHDLKSVPGPRPHISDVIREIWRDAPADEMAKLPRDGASQVGHYVYGLPKRDQ